MVQTAEKVRVTPRAVEKYLAQIAMVFAVQFAAGRLGDALVIINSGGIGPVWPASGIALAVLLLFGYQLWPGVMAGAFLLAFLSPIPHIAAVVYAAGTTLATLTAALLLRRVVKFCASLSHLRDALGLIVFGAFGSSIVSASIGVSVLYAAHVHGWSRFSRAWLIYWLGDSMGVLLVTPLVLTFPNLLRIRPRVRIAEFVALLLCLTVACFIVFGDLPLISVKLHVLAFAVLPFVIWAAIRFGMIGATLSTLFVAATATAETAVGSGPFAQNTPFTNAILLDVFFAVLSVSGMTLAAVIAEREQAEREREQLVREQAAMEARLRLATIVESTDDAIIGKDMDGIITDWNKGAGQLYGYSAGELIGKPISLLVAPDRAGDFADIMESLRRDKPITHYETVCQKKDGTRIEVSLTMSPIRDTEGRIVGASVIGRDVTDRKLAERELSLAHERLRLAMQAGRAGGWEWEIKSGRSFRFGETHALLGTIPEAYCGAVQEFWDCVHPDDRVRLHDAVENAKQNNTEFNEEFRVVWPNGTVHWLRSQGKFFYAANGEAERMLGIAVNITGRKQAEEALRKSEERFRLAAQAGKMFAYEWDAATDVIVRSAESAPILGIDGGTQVTGQQILTRVHPDDREKLKAAVTALSPEKPYLLISYRMVRPDSTVIWVERNSRAHFDEQGRMLRIIGMAADVTERKMAEEALASLSGRLIEAQEEECARIAREVHDDYTQRLALLAIDLEDLAENVATSHAEAGQRLHQLWNRVSELGADLHSLSHRLHSSTLESLGLVQGIKAFCEEFADQQEVQIDFAHENVPRGIPSDVALCLFRITQEALRNIKRHSGVSRAEVRLEGLGDNLHLSVVDQGKGFDTNQRSTNGGIGIRSMEERLRLLGGRLEIYSRPMEGTRIDAWLPFKSDSRRAA